MPNKNTTVVDELVVALEAIRAGRVSNNLAERLSDTDMAKLAHKALEAAGLGAKISPIAADILEA